MGLTRRTEKRNRSVGQVPHRPIQDLGTSCSDYYHHYLQAGSESKSRSVVSHSLRPHGPYSLWNPPGQNTRVGSLSHLQGIFPTQGLNPGLPHCRQILYHPSHQGSPQAGKGPSVPGKLEDNYTCSLSKTSNDSYSLMNIILNLVTLPRGSGSLDIPEHLSHKNPNTTNMRHHHTVCCCC